MPITFEGGPDHGKRLFTRLRVYKGLVITVDGEEYRLKGWHVKFGTGKAVYVGKSMPSKSTKIFMRLDKEGR